MRISNQLMINNFLFNLRRISEDIDTSNRKLSTGLKFSRPSEAPIDMSLSLTLSEKIDLTDQFGRNAADGQTLMDFVDITLSGATEDAQAARTLILQGINGALSEDDREGSARRSTSFWKTSRCSATQPSTTSTSSRDTAR